MSYQCQSDTIARINAKTLLDPFHDHVPFFHLKFENLQNELVYCFIIINKISLLQFS